MKITATPSTTKGTITIRNSIDGGTIPAGLAGKLGRFRRCAAGALPAAVSGEDVAQRGQAVVIGGALLVIHHEQALGPRPDLLGHSADRLADVVLRGRRLAPGALGLVREDAGGAPTGARLGGRGRPRPPHADEQAAVRAALRLLGPLVTDLPLDQEVTVRTVGVTCCRLLAGCVGHRVPWCSSFRRDRFRPNP